MRNWKELGEVPDSDEEDFETQESLDQQTDPGPTIIPPLRIFSADAKNDIWAIPDSSPEVTGEDNRLQPENATSSQHGSPKAASTTAHVDRAVQHVVHGQNKRRSQSSDVMSPSRKPPPALESPFLQRSINETFLEQTAVDQPIAISLQDEDMDSDSEQLSPTSSVRLSRSLRPRKPIQQHPYLVESVQYQQFMKSHGMKPLRVGDGSQKRVAEGDSQDQDFNGEDSQLSSRGGVDAYEASQSVLFDDPLNDRDELALSPSPRTSSPRRLLLVSSQPSNDENTDRTSVAGDEDFPTLEELGTWKAKLPGKALKRQGSTNLPSSRKRLRAKNALPLEPTTSLPSNDMDKWDMSPSPPVFRLPRGASELSVTPPRSNSAGRWDSPSRPPLRRTASELSVPPEHESEVVLIRSDESDQSSGASDSESEIVKYNVRRIRGVLPASWLRLDQKTGRDKTYRALHEKHPEHSPERIVRRGVAQPKQRSPGRSSPSSLPLTSLFFEDDDNDDDDDNNDSNDNDKPSRHGDDTSILGFVDSQKYADYQGEAEEEDFIDRMLPSQKRKSASLGGHRKTKRRKGQPSVSVGSSIRKPRQQKISNLLSVSSHGTLEAPASKRSNGKNTKTRDLKPQAYPLRAHTPPRLSILDVAESTAPRFIKIAARTARKREAMGKSSPSHKHINLGNRMDNIDALSVLQDWKSGRIQPRITQPGPRPRSHTKPIDSRKPLNQLSLNTAAYAPVSQPKVANLRQQPTTTQANLDNYVTSGSTSRHSVKLGSGDRRPKIVSRRRNHEPSLRPAQLETVEDDRPGNPGFTARKRYLDALYRKRRERDLTSTSSHVEQQSHEQAPLAAVYRRDQPKHDAIFPTNNESRRQRPRFRKRFVPRFQDLEAPQYVHANDPVDPSGFIPEPERLHEDEEKLLGLYPFGLHYTHHFDIFPLDSGVFFNDTTLIGQGVFTAAADPEFVQNLASQRNSISTDFGERNFQWNCWTETTSSEIGILFDWITEQLTTTRQMVESWQDIDKAEVANFILRYTLHALSFADQDGKESFINRMSELFCCLLDTLEAAPHRDWVDNVLEARSRSQTCSSLLVVALILLRICQSSSSYYAARTQSERILVRLARVTIDSLLRAGLGDVQKLYDDMQRPVARQRGISSEEVTIHSWVVVIRALENAQVPRSGFWDVAFSTMELTQVNTCSDAQHFEVLWRRLFVLLPLGEFDNAGVLIPGFRYSVPLQGWALPQQLLKRVFQLYRKNPRQSPSFNEYCRAIVSRCYFLVQQWGWYKCSGIIGTIFDFFGSQNLEHLRNEEVFKSPQFLENLTHNPSLSISPEDRCFHIFLKMLAMAIQNLARLDLMNDVKNLVARTLPNHNRQYSKEQIIHQHELAALRNHHDLLCTLFWSAPPDLRPPPQLIEKLVAPGSSHKEACLINLRAWNQLARFVVCSSEETNIYRPFAIWHNNVFQQVLEQYLCAESDIQQQYLALSKDVSKNIGQYVLKNMVSQNRAAAMDILHFSVTAALDVLKHTPSLAAAMYCFNSIPFEKIFTKFDVTLEISCWSAVGAGFDAVDHFMCLLEKALDEQYSFETSGCVDASQTEEALLLLDQRVASRLISVTRRIMTSCQDTALTRLKDRTALLEKAVILCGRIASRFIHAGITRLSCYFKSGKYALFDNLPHNLGLLQKKHVPLFVATLAKNNVFDLKDVGLTMFELWITSIVKPTCGLSFENHLAEALKMHNFPYVEIGSVISGSITNYSSNRDSFASCIRYMRNSLRLADSVQRRNLRGEFAAVLKLVMQQMKDYFKALDMDSTEHHLYISFVRDIVALIKSYGADICPVDDFYYQPSREYAPSVEDPQLHTAGIIAYGIRLGEGEMTAAPQLFYYLLNNFKTAMINDRLDEERKILEKGMANQSIRTFVINRMLPSIIHATLRSSGAWALLQVYSGALLGLLKRSCLPQEIPEESAQDVLALLQAVLSWIAETRDAGTLSDRIDPIQLYNFVQLVGICNTLAPTLMSWSCQLSDPVASDLHILVSQINAVTDNAISCLARLPRAAISDPSTSAASVRDLFDPAVSSFSVHAQVQTFTQHIATDVSKNWVLTSNTITVKVPLKTQGTSGTQSGQGTKHDLYTRDGLLDELYDELRTWSHRMNVSQERKARRWARSRVDGSTL